MKNSKLLIYCLLFCVFYSCVPTLNVSEIEKKINNKYTSLFEGDVENLIKNTPKKHLKEYGESGFREKLTKVYDKRKYPVGYSAIGELVVEDRKKCNSFFFYKVNYLVTRNQMTPYLDSTALKLNRKIYGEENVFFNSNSKFLHVTEKKSEILVFDNDRKWKVHNYDIKFLNEGYGEKFSKCIQTK